MDHTKLTDVALEALRSLGGLATPDQVTARIGWEQTPGSVKALGHIMGELVKMGVVKRRHHAILYEIVTPLPREITQE